MATNHVPLACCDLAGSGWVMVLPAVLGGHGRMHVLYVERYALRNAQQWEYADDKVRPVRRGQALVRPLSGKV
jgi:hypothetical protein